MDGKNGLILWVLGGTGVLFMYSAYKARSPQDVLLTHLGAKGKTPAAAPSTGPGLDVKTGVQLEPAQPKGLMFA